MPGYDFLMFVKNPVRSCTGYSLRVCISNGRLKISRYLCYLNWEKRLCKCDLADGSGHETLSWIMWVGPNVLTSVFLREGYEDNVETEAEIGVIWPQAKEC